ncbi:MAG: type II toxin-antitoxin system RelE/ParE family toxin [Dehalococcoidales bacterium]|nr:type II toxin-antitoxin system RelE/ParE family toxin [Dehalococcoidales bacterium]
MSDFNVEFYETSKGEIPVLTFMSGLDKKLQAKTAMLISLLQDNGNELREPYSKHISEGIFELRAQVGTNESRILYFFYHGRNIILTNGFIKKTQKTPAK